MRTVTRRTLLGGAVAVLAGGVGASAGWLTAPKRRVPAVPPAPRAPILAAELTREIELLARLDATLAANPQLAGVLPALRDDHAAHVAALRSLLRSAGVTPVPSSSPTPSGPSTGAAAPQPYATVAELAAAESAAATGAGAASLRLAGAAAATLASMSGCESGHLALLA